MPCGILRNLNDKMTYHILAGDMEHCSANGD